MKQKIDLFHFEKKIDRKKNDLPNNHQKKNN